MTYREWRTRMDRLINICRRLHARDNQDRLVNILRATGELNNAYPEYVVRSYGINHAAQRKLLA